ncbi:MAG: hypothetical protein A2061_06250 [Gallionellales bacterium GWA2_59_43]|nr:MAG: hypothetical protein A2061_06250 [Gallionellales bacterium GWA2_59_43]
MTATILVVDDSADDRRLYQRALKDSDCRLVLTSTGEDGFASAVYLKPDLILLDYHLPDMDGIDFIKLLKKYPCPSLPIVVLTGEGNAEVAVEMMKHGAADYLVKDTAGLYLRLLPTVVERIMAASAQREETRRLQQETEALLHRNRALMKNAKDGIHVMDVDGNLLEANDAFYRMLGYTAEETPGLNVADWNVQWTKEELRARFKSMVGKSAVFETRHRCKDGTLIDVEISTSGVQIDGRNLFFASSRDITERKRAEEELRLSAQLLNSTSDSVFLLDPDGNFLYLNEAAWKSRGYTRDELMAMNVRELNTPESGKLIAPRLKELLEKGHGIFEAEHRCKDGSIISVEVNSRVIESGGRKLFLSASRDITERKKAEAILKLHKQVIDTSIDGFWVCDMQGYLLDANEAYAKMSGYAVEELVHMHISQLEAREQAADVRAHVAKVIAQGYDRFETRHRHKDGHEIDIEVSTTCMAEQQRLVVFCRDIGERKNAEQALLKNEANLRAILDNSPYLTWLKDTEGRYITINKVFADYLRLEDASQVAGKTDLDLQPQELAEKYRADDAEVMAARQQKHVEEAAFDGNTVHWVETWKTPVIDAQGNVLGTAGFARDITERKQAEQALLQENETGRKQAEEALRISALRHQLLFESSRDALMLAAPPSWKFTAANQATLQLFGAASHAEFTALGPWDVSPERQPDGRLSSEGAQEMLAIAIRDGSNSFEWEHRRLNGETFSADVLITRQEVGGELFVQATVRDITERKQTAAELHRLNRALRLLSACNTALVHAAEEEPLLAKICQLVVETGGYHMAWIGMAEYDQEKSVHPVAQCGFEEGYLSNANISWADNTERGRGPIGIAIRTGVTQINHDFENNPLLAPWREAALARGYRSSIALPLRRGAQTFAVLAIYSATSDSFSIDEVALLEELADNMSYGISALRLRIEHDQAVEKLHKSAQEIEGLYNQAPCGYHSLDADSIVRSINDTELAWLGYTRDEVVGKMKFTELISPARIPDFQRTFAQLKQQGFVRDIESEQMRKDGTLFSVLINATAIYDADGNYLMSRSTLVDITKRKQAEEKLRENDVRLRALVGNLPGTVFEMMVGEGGEVSLPYVSVGVATLFGVAADELMSQPELLFSCVDAEDAPGFEASRSRSAQTLGAWDWEGRVNTAAQQGKWLSLRATPRRQDDGSIVWGGVILNITQCKRAELELVKSQQLLRNLVVQGEVVRDDERKRIARELHDELGQLLTALRMNIALMRIRLGACDMELQTIISRVTGLLDQSIRCTRHVVSNLRPAALDMGIVPAIRWLCDEFTTHTGTPCVLHADETEVQLDEALAMTVFRVVQEALTNASRYAEASKVDVAIKLDADNIAVTVNDNGKGFDSSARSKPASFGLLGMRERAIALGAVVNIDSAPQQGTRISFVVPNNGSDMKGSHP